MANACTICNLWSFKQLTQYFKNRQLAPKALRGTVPNALAVVCMLFEKHMKKEWKELGLHGSPLRLPRWPGWSYTGEASWFIWSPTWELGTQTNGPFSAVPLPFPEVAPIGDAGVALDGFIMPLMFWCLKKYNLRGRDWANAHSCLWLTH